MNNKKIYSLLCNNIFVIFYIFLSFFKPLSLYYFKNINLIYNAVMALNGLIIIYFYYQYFIKTKQISRIQKSVILLFMCLFISTLFGTRDFATLFKTYIKWIAISMYTEILIKNNFCKLLDSVTFIIYSYIIINFITMLLFKNGIFNPDGLTPVFFLGNDNTTTIMLVLGTLFIFLRSYYYHNKLDFFSISSLFLIIYIYIKNWSATSMIGSFLLIIYILLIYKKKDKFNIFNYKNYIIFGFILFISVVIFRVQNYFSFIIEDIFKKSITLTGRTNIWDNCFYYIKHNLLLGLGVQEFEKRYRLISIFHAHCTLLNYILEGGLIALIALINIFKNIYNKIKLNENNQLIKIISYSFFIYLFVGLAEVYQDSQMFYIFIVLAYFSENIIKNRNYELNNYYNKKR